MNDMFREDRPAEGTPKVADVPSLAPDLAARHEPFPLTDVQKAYWIGRSGTFDLGHIGCHVYLEVKLAAHDSERLQAAWQMLIQHHDMLRAIVREGRPAADPRRGAALQDRAPRPEQRRPGFGAGRSRSDPGSMSHQVFRPTDGRYSKCAQPSSIAARCCT
jgi:hypothetical protein